MRVREIQRKEKGGGVCGGFGEAIGKGGNKTVVQKKGRKKGQKKSGRLREKVEEARIENGELTEKVTFFLETVSTLNPERKEVTG